MAVAIHRFESVESYVGQVQAVANRNGQFWMARGGSWDAGVAGDEACRRGIQGDPSLAAASLDTLADLETHTSGGTRSKYVASVAGFRVSVPDYLGGSPTCMRRRARVECETRHVNIYVCLACRGDVTSANLLARGSAILALLEYLQSTGTSVDLYLLAELANGRLDSWQVIRVESRPLDLSTAGFAIAHPAFGRSLSYAYAEAIGSYSGQWSDKAHDLDKGSARWGEYIRQELGLSPADVLIPYTREYDQVVTDPSGWLKARIQQLAGDQT